MRLRFCPASFRRANGALTSLDEFRLLIMLVRPEFAVCGERAGIGTQFQDVVEGGVKACAYRWRWLRGGQPTARIQPIDSDAPDFVNGLLTAAVLNLTTREVGRQEKRGSGHGGECGFHRGVVRVSPCRE